MNLDIFSRLSAVVLLGFFMQAQSAEPDFQPEFPRTMSWSAYNLGTTGYNQAVGIGKALKDNYNVNLRVLPGKTDVSRLWPLQRGRVQFSANGVATYFGQGEYFSLLEKLGDLCRYAWLWRLTATATKHSASPTIWA